jgi:hypothetical protein
MTRTPLILMFVAAAALAGCDNGAPTVVGGPADDGTNSAANAGVTLPPPIAASKVYRCADNSIISVDWLGDQKTANVRTEQNGMPTQVTTAEAGQPMTAPNGLALTGSATAASITVKLPDGGTKTCKA